MLTDLELGWMAGLLEGEGYFGYVSKTTRMSVQMTDEDTIVRLAKTFEKVVGYYPNILERPIYKGTQPTYMVYLDGENARKVMRLIVLHMSQRRKVKIWQTLNGYIAPKLKLDLNSLGLVKNADT